MGTARFLPRIPVHKALVFVFTSLMVYIWLALTQRLTYHADLIVGIGAGVAAARWFVNHQERAFRVWRTMLPWLIVGVILTGGFVQARELFRERNALAKLPPAAPASPNVLVIVVDTLRADHMSGCGYARPTTPRIDQLARQGVLFENAISTSSWTLPSHACMLTG